MLGKVALFAVALILLSTTVAAAGLIAELDNAPSPSDLELTEAYVPVFTSSSVWPGTIPDDAAVPKVFISSSVWPGTIQDWDTHDNATAEF